jgi:3-deoxy-D-manno-octulosonic-acid transferase
MWSGWQAGAGEALGDSVLVVDTVGDLERIYSIADLAVVGGSFVPHGGHNVLEPASLSRAVLVGPHTENFEDEVSLLLAGRGGILARDPEELEKAVAELLGNAEELEKMGQRARETFSGLSGAVERHVEWIERALSLSKSSGN